MKRCRQRPRAVGGPGRDEGRVQGRGSYDALGAARPGRSASSVDRALADDGGDAHRRPGGAIWGGDRQSVTGVGGDRRTDRVPSLAALLGRGLAMRDGQPAQRSCAGRLCGGRTPHRDRRGEWRKATPFYSHPTDTGGRAKSPRRDAALLWFPPLPLSTGAEPPRRGAVRSVAPHGRRHVGRPHHLKGANLVPRLW